MICLRLCPTAVLHPPHPDRWCHYWHGWHKGGHRPGLTPSNVHHHCRHWECWFQWHADAGWWWRDPVFNQRRTCSPRHCSICALPELQKCEFIVWFNRTHKQTNNQTIKQTNRQTNQQKQTNKQANEQRQAVPTWIPCCWSIITCRWVISVTTHLYIFTVAEHVRQWKTRSHIPWCYTWRTTSCATWSLAGSAHNVNIAKFRF